MKNRIISSLIIGLLLIGLVSACYQESPIQKFKTDGKCGLNYHGSYVGLTGNTTDGNWDTFTKLNGQSLTINYIKPKKAISGSFIISTELNNKQVVNIPSLCLNKVVTLYVQGVCIDSDCQAQWLCKTSTGWINIFNGGGTSDDLYEEAINWRIR